jgi:hypothetical protein
MSLLVDMRRSLHCVVRGCVPLAEDVAVAVVAIVEAVNVDIILALRFFLNFLVLLRRMASRETDQIRSDGVDSPFHPS